MPHTSASRTTQLFKKSLEMHLKREKHSGNSDNMKQWLSLERSIFGPLAGCYDFHPKPCGLLTKVLDTEMFFVSEMAVVLSNKLIGYNIPNTKHTYTNHIFGAINSSVPQVSNYVTLAILLSHQTVEPPSHSQVYDPAILSASPLMPRWSDAKQQTMLWSTRLTDWGTRGNVPGNPDERENSQWIPDSRIIPRKILPIILQR